MLLCRFSLRDCARFHTPKRICCRELRRRIAHLWIERVERGVNGHDALSSHLVDLLAVIITERLLICFRVHLDIPFCQRLDRHKGKVSSSRRTGGNLVDGKVLRDRRLLMRRLDDLSCFLEGPFVSRSYACGRYLKVTHLGNVYRRLIAEILTIFGEDLPL